MASPLAALKLTLGFTYVQKFGRKIQDHVGSFTDLLAQQACSLARAQVKDVSESDSNFRKSLLKTGNFVDWARRD
jgi:hypothetical protein